MFYGDWKYVRAETRDRGTLVIFHGAVNYRTGLHVTLDFSPDHAMDDAAFQALIELNFPTRKSFDLDRPLLRTDLLQL